MFRSSLLIGFVFALLLLTGAGPRSALAQNASETTPVIVVELFTSQGCSACPPADRFLAKMAEEPGLIALSLHVDYWDYLGWRDRFARPENTARQKNYAAAMQARSIYTPQMVIQGQWRRIGSDVKSVREAIEAARSIAPVARIDIEPGEARITVRVAPLSRVSFTSMGILHFISYDRPQRVKIERGENSGVDMTYVNVVRDWMKLGYWDGTSAQAFQAPTPEMGRGVAVLLQDGPVGAILAAARLEP
ncbi:MAG: DUF1223 domain-containing protein [Pseudomonadota bacterium]